jgi:hypothetical protein
LVEGLLVGDEPGLDQLLASAGQERPFQPQQLAYPGLFIAVSGCADGAAGGGGHGGVGRLVHYHRSAGANFPLTPIENRGYLHRLETQVGTCALRRNSSSRRQT